MLPTALPGCRKGCLEVGAAARRQDKFPALLPAGPTTRTCRLPEVSHAGCGIRSSGSAACLGTPSRDGVLCLGRVRVWLSKINWAH